MAHTRTAAAGGGQLLRHGRHQLPLGALRRAHRGARSRGRRSTRLRRLLPAGWSGGTEQALRDQAGRLREHSSTGTADLDDDRIGWSLATTRATFEYRAVLAGEDRAAAPRRPGRPRRQRPPPRPRRAAGRHRRTVLVFPGQGSQWHGMAVDLLDRSRSSGSTWRHAPRHSPSTSTGRCWTYCDRRLGAPSLDRSDVVQPTLFAVMVSLARSGSHWASAPTPSSATPRARSPPPTSPARFTLHEAARISALRSKVPMELRQAATWPPCRCRPTRSPSCIAESGAPIEIGASTAPATPVLCGPTGRSPPLDVRARDAPGRLVNIDYAVALCRRRADAERLLAGSARSRPRSSDIPFCSTVTGEPWTPPS